MKITISLALLCISFCFEAAKAEQFGLPVGQVKTCGQSMSLALVQNARSKHFSLSQFSHSGKQVCLVNNSGAPNANYRIELLDQKNNHLFSQNFFLSQWEYYDHSHGDESNKKLGGGVREVARDTYKNIRLPNLWVGKAMQFRVVALKTGAIVGKGVIR